MAAPKPDTSHVPTILGQSVVEVVYARSKRLRCVISIDAAGIYRVRTDFWDTSDWDIVGEAFWVEQHSGTLVDTLEHAKCLCLEHMHELMSQE
jgi:hypothetical protein